jgi:hypothetical protein
VTAPAPRVLSREHVARLAPPPPPDVDEERRARRASALVALAEAGVLEAARRRHDAVERARAILTRAIAARLIHQDELERLSRLIPPTVGAFVICERCRQVGEARDVFNRRLRWIWSGRDALGHVAHHSRVVQARDIGDMPPRLCPDHEVEAVKAGELASRSTVTLERGGVR